MGRPKSGLLGKKMHLFTPTKRTWEHFHRMAHLSCRTSTSGAQHTEVVYERTYYFVLKVIGGPLYVNVKQKADPLAFDKHPSGDTESVPLSWEYPWYGTDFGYNPFLYRNNANFKESSDQQTLNRFFAKPLWSQPEGTKIFYNVDAPGVFLNQNPEIFHDEYGIKSPYATWGLPRNRDVLISNHEIDPGENPDDKFTIVASYTYYRWYE